MFNHFYIYFSIRTSHFKNAQDNKKYSSTSSAFCLPLKDQILLSYPAVMSHKRIPRLYKQ